jgi:hypothetical protein
MKILVAIPSYNRPYEIENKCGYWLKQLKNIEWKVFVREDQFLYYEQVIPEENLVSIDVNSYRETINAIGEYARDHNYDLVHRIDDDMSFKKMGLSKKVNASEVYKQIYHDVPAQFEQNTNLYGVSVSKPMTHIREREKVWIKRNKCLYGNQWLRPSIMYLPEGIELFDDVFMTLKILQEGKETLTYAGAYEDSVVHKNAGGLQSIDRNKISRETIKEFQKYFPEVKEGNYKGKSEIVDIDLKALNIK